ncbi:hypothetical protein KR018_007032 [Drosophila ironensis]|nr:hypothetical protein KR018_007032 [Drosophila ironensis]
MSIPKHFSNADTYFDAVLDFLCSYSWIYREPNTSFIASIDLMPLDFKKYFLQISTDDINVFPLLNEKLVDCPPSVLSFRQKIEKLTPIILRILPNSNLSLIKKSKYIKGVAAKKMLEVSHLAKHIHAHCGSSSTLVIDLGAGLGYLSQALHDINSNYLILGFESNSARVEKARQRCHQNFKAIGFQQQFVDENSIDFINSEALKHGQINGFSEVNTMSIIGLHACADLSINAMRLFLKMPKVRCIHIMPCCYHKLELQTHNRDKDDFMLFANFPLSNALQKSIEWRILKPILNRPFLRLACQRTKAHWGEDKTVRERMKHGYRMFMRAAAEAIRDSNETVKPKRNIRQMESHSIDFCELKRMYQLQLKETGAHVKWQNSHEEKFLKIITKFPDKEGPYLAVAFTCLQTALQKLCENIVLLDRLCFLEEEAAKQKLSISTRYEAIFDELVSPRCHVLVAEKLS